MHETSQTSIRGRVTVTELVVVVIVLAVLASMLVPALRRSREEARRIRCPHHLIELAKGMAMYLEAYGDKRWYPCPLGRGQTPGNYNGAEWLASLYWTRVVPDPSVFICPASPDDNDDGHQLGCDRAIPGLFGSQTVGYAGMHYYSMRDDAGNPVPGAIPADYPPNLPMACDDSQGESNHGSGFHIVFFDLHTEGREDYMFDYKPWVGKEDDLLRDLRN
jgi:hypothetical protein